MNKVVLVTGGAKRIGAQICEVFHQHGWDLILHYHSSQQDAQKVAARLNLIRPNSVCLLQGDLSSELGTRQVADASLAAFGRLDALINNASIFPKDVTLGVQISMWEHLFRCNAFMPHFLLKYLADELSNRHGSVVNMLDTRIAPLNPIPEWALYTASKAALHSLTLSDAREYAPKVRVNAVAPGITLPVPGEHWDENELNVMNARNLLGKVASPDDIAQSVYWMAIAPHVTGQILAVDGGEPIKC